MAALSYRLGQLAGSVAKGFNDTTKPKPLPPAKPDLGNERGFTGLKVFAGLIDEEYQAALEDVEDRITVYEKMRADADVSALEAAILQPLLAAQYEVKPHEDATDAKLAQEQADAATRMIEELDVPWSTVAAHAYKALFAGFAFAEKVWAERDGLYVWDRIALRRPDSVYQWVFDEKNTGQLVAISQQGYRVVGETSQYARTEPIDLAKLFLWTYRPDYGNPEGRGLFRDIYRHWYIKDKAYTAACIRIERLAMPTPMATPLERSDGTYPDTSQTELDAFGEALGRLRVYEQGRIILPAGYQVTAFELGDPSVPWMDFITHHGGMILRSGLAQFLALGQDGNTGAWALAEDSSSFFLMALASHAKWFCETMNRQGIRQFVDANWGRPKDGKYPTLEHSGLGVKDKKALAEVMRVLAGGQENLLDRKDEIANVMREVMGFEQIAEDEIEAEKLRREEQAALGLEGAKAALGQAQAGPAAAPAAPGAPGGAGARQGAPKPAAKQPPAESVKTAEGDPECDCAADLRLADTAFDAALTRAEGDFQAEGAKVVGDMIAQYVRKLTPLAEAGDYLQLAELTVPLQGKYENWLKRYLWQVVDLGRARLERDTGRAAGPKSRRLSSWVNGKAKLLAEGHAGNLKWVVGHTLLQELRAGKAAASVLTEAAGVMTTEMTDRLDGDLNIAAAEAVERVTATGEPPKEQ
jgi:hypothetical protein